MRQEFSTSWVGSKQVRKQRKYVHNAPLHVKHTFLSAHLAKDLRKQHGKRNMSVRKGDEVLIMRGSFAGKKAKIASVDVKSVRVTLENITRQKKDGTKLGVVFHPSNLQIVSLNMEDRNKTVKSKQPKEKKQNASNKS